MDSDQLLALMKRRDDDPAVEAAFVTLRTRRRPVLDPEDDEAFLDWVLVRRQGVELGFADEVYFQAGEKSKRRRKGAPLILFQIYFYTQRDDDDIKEFTGRLPFGLQWSDNRDQARQKLFRHESTRRSHLKDVWELPGYRMTVGYKKGNKAIDSIVCEVGLNPWPEKGRVQPTLGISDWPPLFGLPSSSSTLRERLHPLDLDEKIEEDEHELDFRYECGLELYFTQSKNLKLGRRRVLTKGQDLVFGAVRFYRSRELDARQWIGELPFQLSFDDTQQRMIEKVGRPPDEQDDDDLEGFGLWYFEGYSLHVYYSNMDNRLYRVTLMAPGY
ncbi:MAG: hypothetical protein WAO55_01420 [Candidatus Manganitrophaceae bacterium]